MLKVREMINKETFSNAPLKVKIAVVFLIVYLLSPIDLIPDFIPVIGQLDDILIAGLVYKYAQKYTNLNV
jgi:uncharacterized membrane protein YkvA (DUF1232 family)